MKKIRWFTLLALIAIFSVLALAGCSKKGDTVSSVSLKDHNPNTAIEMAVGEFDFNAYTVVVAYESGITEEMALTEQMISQTDIFKLYQIGEHDITISYKKHNYTFKVSVKRASFENLAFPEYNVFTYDGKEHLVEVNGNIPANAVVTYPGGNSFVNAGTYDVIAIVSCDGYVTQKLTTTVKIERAKHDMSGVKFESKEFVYDGNSHSIAISGTLPEGVSSPTYTINEKTSSSATDVGEYKVIAHFNNSNPNYEAIPNMEATLKITPAEYTVKGVDIVFRSESGDIINDAIKMYDGKSITFDLNDYNKLSNKVSVSFSVCDEDGKVISNSNKDTGIINAGVYTVKAEFALTDGKNYKPIVPIIRTFEILKANYPPIENIHLGSAQITYNGKEHSIKIEGELPEGVTVSYEYYKDNTLIVDAEGKPVQSVVDTGIYTVKAVFSHENQNLESIPDIIAALNIKKVEIILSVDGISTETLVEYSGKPHESKFTEWEDIEGIDDGILKYGVVKYYVLDGDTQTYIEMGKNELPTDVGLYMATIDISIAEEYRDRYVWPGDTYVKTVSKRLEILKKEIEVPGVDFTSDLQLNYTAEAQKISYVCDADLKLMTLSTAYFKYIAGEYIALTNGELPVDKGLYKFVVTVTVNDLKRYVFSSGKTVEEFSLEFEILPKTIDVSGIALSYTEVTYNENDQTPKLQGVPEHVLTTVKFYSINGTTPADNVINAGKYRCEIVLSTDSSNYVLSSNEKLVLGFEIIPITINVSGLLFDTVEFSYSGSNQQPNLVGIPAHVKTKVRLNAVGEEKLIDLAVNAGTYNLEVKLVAESSNYELSGNTTYSTEFEILAQKIYLEELLVNDNELEWVDNGYTDKSIATAIGNALFGGKSAYVECLVASIWSVDESKSVNAEDLVAGGRYEILCHLDVIGVKDSYDVLRYNYVLVYNGQGFLATQKEFCFIVVN